MQEIFAMETVNNNTLDFVHLKNSKFCFVLRVLNS